MSTADYAELPNSVNLGNGAQFWVYLSPLNLTADVLSEWCVTFESQTGGWRGQITSANPQATLQAPGLAGIFKVTVTAFVGTGPEQQLTPVSGNAPEVGCNSNCAAMVGIMVQADRTSANFWTTSDAYCG